MRSTQVIEVNTWGDDVSACAGPGWGHGHRSNDPFFFFLTKRMLSGASYAVVCVYRLNAERGDCAHLCMHGGTLEGGRTFAPTWGAHPT